MISNSNFWRGFVIETMILSTRMQNISDQLKSFSHFSTLPQSVDAARAPCVMSVLGPLVGFSLL